jgi:hypothetical protein
LREGWKLSENNVFRRVTGSKGDESKALRKLNKKELYRSLHPASLQ